jgi:uncharacterized FAD-dependent dehydrogenase
MQQKISIQVSPQTADKHSALQASIAEHCGVSPSRLFGFQILRQSIDARSRAVKINLTILAFIDEPLQERERLGFHFQDTRHSELQTLIIGAGPAGLFAALQLIEKGIRPVILERGKDVKARRRDLALLNREGKLDEDSNYCFGEGGAGTYSDGKLYTRSNKRGNINRILQLLVHFGADEKILYESHPHIGTNKLPQIITAMREQIVHSGGQIHFGQRVNHFNINNDMLVSVQTLQGNQFQGDDLILATGHSARDIFTQLQAQGLEIEAKPFALGVRIEHPQELIDSIQYHCDPLIGRSSHLPPSSYSLVEQVQSRGVFSFCMCPGGIIATASTSPGELVVNGWSPSKRNNPFANSGMVVQVEKADAWRFLQSAHPKKIQEDDPLLIMHFQSAVEQKAYQLGGGKFVAPAQRMEDFTRGKLSTSLPPCSYIPGIRSAPLDQVLPPFVGQRLQQAFLAFGKKMRGYLSNEAVVVATESRTSSPVRIPRDPILLHHPKVKNLYPCGEGPGYAGGIVSAAMDGENVAMAIVRKRSITHCNKT